MGGFEMGKSIERLTIGIDLNELANPVDGADFGEPLGSVEEATTGLLGQLDKTEAYLHEGVDRLEQFIGIFGAFGCEELTPDIRHEWRLRLVHIYALLAGGCMSLNWIYERGFFATGSPLLGDESGTKGE
jgi:hypothetical protein